MEKFINYIRSMRVSSLIFLAFLPFIIFAILSSRNYGKAIKAILGIEENAGSLFIAFLLILSITFLGVYAAKNIFKFSRVDFSQNERNKFLYIACVSLFLKVLCSIILFNTNFLELYTISIAANSFDARTTDWIIMVDKSFTLRENTKTFLLDLIRQIILCEILFTLIILVISLLRKNLLKGYFFKFSVFIFGSINFCILFYILMVAHAGFALGLAVTLRAAFFAYFLACILGLVWALLSKLQPRKSSSIVLLILGLISIFVSAFNYSRPHETLVLVGTLTGKIGIIAGTPQSVSDQVRYGDFLAKKPDKPFKVRSMKKNSQAIDLFEKNKLSAILVKEEFAIGKEVIWRTSYLPSKNRVMFLTSGIIGFLILLLVGIGSITKMHPLSIFSDFFVDTIRGIPMLVIILYIGLPLAGAIKSASAGYIDMQMMTRGIIAIGIGYSAYMAEIFRAGIEAISRGQIEAARSLGMKETHIARFIILPQAIAIVLPALGNEFIAMLKDTSLVSILSVRDITQRMREFQAQSFLPFEPFNSAALLYIILTLIAASLIKRLERVVNRGRAQK